MVGRFKRQCFVTKQSHFCLRGSERLLELGGLSSLVGHSVLGQFICPGRERDNLGTRVSRRKSDRQQGHGALGGGLRTSYLLSGAT